MQAISFSLNDPLMLVVAAGAVIAIILTRMAGRAHKDDAERKKKGGE